MPELKGKELAQLRDKLSELASDLNRTLSRLDEAAKRDYRDAEQSVIDARRKVETREGLLRVG
jgi:predicted transcriptional regulator